MMGGSHFDNMRSKVTLHNSGNSGNSGNSASENAVLVVSIQVKVKTTELLYCIESRCFRELQSGSCEVCPSCPTVTFDLEYGRARYIKRAS